MYATLKTRYQDPRFYDPSLVIVLFDGEIVASYKAEFKRARRLARRLAAENPSLSVIHITHNFYDTRLPVSILHYA